MSTAHLQIAMVAVISSQIAAIGYAPESQTLRVTFADRKDKDTKHAIAGSGSTYDYDNIEPETHQAMIKSDSIGSYFYANIKPNREKYPYRKLDGHHPATVFPQQDQSAAA